MRLHRSNRGSVLATTLIFAMIIAIGLTAYLRLALNSSRLANRSFYLNAAQNLADSGMEYVIWALNSAATLGTPANWTTATFSDMGSNVYRGTFGPYQLSGKVEGTVKVYVNYPTATTPHAVVRATIKLSDGSSISKTNEAWFQQSSFAKGGMVARNGIDFNGNVAIDSWISNDHDSNVGNDIRYTSAIRRAEAHVASPSVITVQNADVFGYVSIGKDTVSSSSLVVGATGKITGNLSVSPPPPNGIDYSRLSYNFTDNFPDVSPVPSSSTKSGATLGALTTGSYFPRYDGSTGAVIDTATGGKYYYYLPNINIGGGETITIGPPTSGVGSTNPAADVVLVIPGNIDLDGTSQIVINPGSKLTIYSGGNINIVGNCGIQNGGTTYATSNMPSYFTLLGTRTAANMAAGASLQDWDISGGGGYLAARVYAPNADVSIWGNGQTYGSIVGDQVHMKGTGDFHQDESLANLRDTNLWEVTKWRDITTGVDLAAVDSLVTF